MADVRDTIRKAVQGDASIDELQAILAKNLDALDNLSDDDQIAFIQEMEGISPDFNRALFRAVTQGEAEDTDIGALLLGDPESRLQTGIGPLLGGRSFASKILRGFADEGEQVLTETGRNILPQVGSVLSRILFGKKGGSTLWRVLSRGGTATVVGSQLLSDDGVSNVGPDGTPLGGTEFQQARIEEKRTGAAAAREQARIKKEGFAQVGGQIPEELPTGFNVMLVDHDGSITGTPGSVVIVSPKDLGLPFSGAGSPADLAAIGATPALGGEQGVIFSELLASSTSALASQDLNILQAIFPQGLGDITVQAPVFQEFTPQERDPFSRGAGPREPAIDSPDIKVPAGAKLAPRSFNTHQGRTLLEWASVAAQRNGVPLSLLYALVNHESNWNPNAVGDDGRSFGLVQIFQPAWPGISQAQALNPVFALEWAAQKLRQRFNQYGRWDAAVAAHNSPVAAEFLARTGKFKTDKSANYTQLILGAANRSGLADTVFTDGSQGDGPETAAAGPTFAPFQTPDPAQSREYLEEVYQQLLGRKPTEDDYVKGVKRIAQLAREAYNSNIRIAKGGESEAVDVGAQFQQEIKAGGEFAFHETVGQTNKFTDYAAGIARLLQQGV